MLNFLCIKPNSSIYAEVSIVDPSLQSSEVPLELNSAYKGCGCGQAQNIFLRSNFAEYSFCMKVHTSELFHNNPSFQLLSFTEFFVETLGLHI